MDGWIVEGFILPHPDGPHRIKRPHSSQIDSLVQHLGFRQAYNLPGEEAVEDLHCELSDSSILVVYRNIILHTIRT